eukprot:4024008-Pleurochrysis_carterae.AAC.3
MIGAAARRTAGVRRCRASRNRCVAYYATRSGTTVGSVCIRSKPRRQAQIEASIERQHSIAAQRSAPSTSLTTALHSTQHVNARGYRVAGCFAAAASSLPNSDSLLTRGLERDQSPPPSPCRAARQCWHLIISRVRGEGTGNVCAILKTCAISLIPTLDRGARHSSHEESTNTMRMPKCMPIFLTHSRLKAAMYYVSSHAPAPTSAAVHT